MYSIKMTFSADWNWKRLVWERELWKWEGAQAAFCQIRASVQRNDYTSANHLEGSDFFLLCTFNKARNRATCSLTTRGSAYTPAISCPLCTLWGQTPHGPSPAGPSCCGLPPMEPGKAPAVYQVPCQPGGGTNGALSALMVQSSTPTEIQKY